MIPARFFLLALLLGWLLPTGTIAQAPNLVPRWSMATLINRHSPPLYAVVRATAVDEAGSVFIAGRIRHGLFSK